MYLGLKNIQASSKCINTCNFDTFDENIWHPIACPFIISHFITFVEYRTVEISTDEHLKKKTTPILPGLLSALMFLLQNMA